MPGHPTPHPRNGHRRAPTEAARGRQQRLAIDDRGLATTARQIPSPNRDARPPGTGITLVVVHGISLPPGEFGGDGIVELFTNRLDPGAHPYYATIAAPRRFGAFPCPARRGADPVRPVHRARVACRGLDLEGPRPLQRLLDRNRARRRRRGPVHGGAVLGAGAPGQGAAAPLPDRRRRRPQRRRPRPQDGPRPGLRLGTPAPPSDRDSGGENSRGACFGAQLAPSPANGV